MIKDFKNEKDCETIKDCGDKIEALHDKILASGTSKNECTVQQLVKMVNELRKLEKMFQ